MILENQEEVVENPVIENPEEEIVENPDDNGGEAPAPEEYVPNHKFTFMDQELEFDDKVKGLIKTKEDEDFFRDMVTAQKAHEKYKELGGIRELEEKFNKLPEYESTQENYQALNQEVDLLKGMLEKGNIEQFRNYLGIPKETLLQWASNEAKAIQDPNFAQQLQGQYQQQHQNFDLHYQNQLMQNNMQQQMVQQRDNQLNQELGNSSVTQAYDNLVGAPGSFRQAVIDYGITHHAQTGRDISVAEAVKAVESKFQGLVANQPNVGTQQAQQQTQVSDPQKTVVINQGGKQTLPNLKAGDSTPAKKQITSLAQIRKLAGEM